MEEYSSMVSRVVAVLDEGNAYLYPGRVLRSKLPKKTPRRQSIRLRSPDNRTEGERSKEQERRTVKDTHPNASLKWNGHRWKVREKEIEQVLEAVEPLLEISLRTGAITGFLMMLKKYRGQVKQGVTKRKSLSSQLRTVKDEKERDRIQSGIETTTGEVDDALASMMSYVGLVSGAGGLGADRSYKLLKKMEKRKRR